MKTKLLFAAILLPTLSFAQSLERKMNVLVRTEKNKPVVNEMVLKDLVSAEAFDGVHFKIVKGKSDEAIKFTDNEALTFRAATAYYHLNRARDYFVNHVKSQYVASIPKMVIRIDHTNQFSELGHFAHDNMEPQYNNALTIPAGSGLESRGVKPWGMEIWFRPSKRIHLRDLRVNDTANREFQVLMRQFRNQTHMQSIQRFLTTAIFAMTENGANMDISDSIIRTVGASVIIEASYQFMDPITKAFSRKWYWLDTALVPEIIYHEYAHAALSDHLVLSHSTAIIEGMADFFAGQIAGSPELAKHIKKYNTYSGKDATKKKDYMLQFEMSDYANTDFVFGMLWELKNILGEEKGESFMFELRKKITTNSTIRGQLVEGILETCEERCEQPFVDKLRILKALNLRGI